jgi:hypothetical protein
VLYFEKILFISENEKKHSCLPNLFILVFNVFQLLAINWADEDLLLTTYLWESNVLHIFFTENRKMVQQVFPCENFYDAPGKTPKKFGEE